MVWKSLKQKIKDVPLKVEGQTTGILEEKLKLESEVTKLKEKLENAGNQVFTTFLKFARIFCHNFGKHCKPAFFNFVENKHFPPKVDVGSVQAKDYEEVRYRTN